MNDGFFPQKENKESFTEVINGEVLFHEKKRQIYELFIDSIRNKAQSKELKENDKAVLDFILVESFTIFKKVDLLDIKPLSEENFCQFLLSIVKKIREKKLVHKKNPHSNNHEIKQIIDDCICDIRSIEARDSLIKFSGLLFGIKIDAKNISDSVISGLKEKIPFLRSVKKEDNEPPLSDQEMVTKFLIKSLLPILFSIASILVFGPSAPAVFATVVGIIFAIKGGIEVLFSNNKVGTLYNTTSQDIGNIEEETRLRDKIYSSIDDILETFTEDKSEEIYR